MNKKFEIKVYNEKGKNVTNEKDWYIGNDGLLYFETSDIDCPLQQAEGFNYKVFLNGKDIEKAEETSEEKELVTITDFFGEEHNAELISNPDAPYLVYEYKARERKYNPNYGDNRLCVCGHPYHKHFDPYENMEARGCKYCGCENFIEKGKDKAES